MCGAGCACHHLGVNGQDEGRAHDAAVRAGVPGRVLRRDGGRIIGGVAGGVADHLGVDVVVVRIVFVVLSALAGAGVCAYGLLWFFCPPGTDTRPPPRGERAQAYGLALVGLAAVVVVGFAASGTPAEYLVPLVVVAVGASLVWREFDTGHGGTRSRVMTWTRVAGGGVLVIGGLVVAVLATDRSFGGLGTTLLAVVATLLGVVLLTVPLWMRMLRTVNAERAARIRAAERDEIATHLHDSVLQTLALIQKQAHRPEEVTRLARGQERELRRWLFGETDRAGSSLAAAVKLMAGDVEDAYGIEVDVVTVGDLTWPHGSPRSDVPDTKRWAALVAAIREALINAAKHSGEHKVDVFAEVTADGVEAFVRDRGRGFDPDAVPHDRQGLAKSIRGRVERHGGSVVVKTAIGRGTEVVLSMPREHHASENATDGVHTVPAESGENR